MDDEKIPLDKVLEDMYNPNGGPVSWAARDYYYKYYATEEEKREMDREDINSRIFVLGLRNLFIYVAIFIIIKCVFG